MNIKKIIILLLIVIVLCFILYFSYYIITVKKQYYINEANLQIPIYTYHDIVSNEEEISEDYMQTTLKNFNKQITGLIKIGYKPIKYQDLLNYKNSKQALYKRSFIITFDDGYKSIYEYIYPLIKEKNIPITIFVIDNCIGSENYLNWEELKEMHDSGLVDIYSHGLNHIDYSQENPALILDEIEKAYLNLRNNLNEQELLKVFAYPYGLYSDESVKILADNGYIQNLMDGKINESKTLNMSMLHRVYPLNDSVFIILLKQFYKIIKY